MRQQYIVERQKQHLQDQGVRMETSKLSVSAVAAELDSSTDNQNKSENIEDSNEKMMQRELFNPHESPDFHFKFNLPSFSCFPNQEVRSQFLSHDFLKPTDLMSEFDTVNKTCV